MLLKYSKHSVYQSINLEGVNHVHCLKMSSAFQTVVGIDLLYTTLISLWKLESSAS